MKPFMTVNAEKCKRDGICVAECPSLVLIMPAKDACPVAIEDAKEHCISCGHCVTVCPTGALSLEWLTPEECPSIDSSLDVTQVQAAQFLRSRRSIRTFKEKAVEREKLEQLIQMACYAPSAKNMQPWHWMVIQDRDRVRELASMVIEWMRFIMKQDPAAAERVKFPRVVEEWDRGDERICRGAPHVIVVHGDRNWTFGAEDGALALNYLSLYAPVLGLDTCWGGYFYTAANHYPPLAQALHLPPEHRAYGAIMVGYPRFTYQRMPLRNPPRVVWA